MEEGTGDKESTDRGARLPLTTPPPPPPAHGLSFTQAEITDPRLLKDIPEAAYMRFHLFTITKPPQQEQQEEAAGGAPSLCLN